MQKGKIPISPFVHNQKTFSTKVETRIRDIRQYGQRARGQANYLKYLQGGRLSASQAIVAFCYSCEGNAGDGSYDCEDVCCPLYPWHPYQTATSPRLPNRAIPEKNGEGLVCSDVGKAGGA